MYVCDSMSEVKQQELEAAKVAAEEALDAEIANVTELEAAKTAAEEAQAAAEEALDLEIADKAELEEKVEALKVELKFAAEEVPSDGKNKDKEALEKKVAKIEADNAKLRDENATLQADFSVAAEL